MEACELDAALATARISAAAAEGDIETAAAILDQMNDTGIAIGITHVSAAIRACWVADGNHHNAAKYLFQLVKQRNLQPNVITFACLIGAYRAASLDSITAAYDEMKGLGILPNKAFAETYLVTVLRVPKGKRWNRNDFVTELRKRSPEQIAAATRALADFQAAGVSLTGLSTTIQEALPKL